MRPLRRPHEANRFARCSGQNLLFVPKTEHDRAYERPRMRSISWSESQHLKLGLLEVRVHHVHLSALRNSNAHA
jgi:hypothetical protein